MVSKELLSELKSYIEFHTRYVNYYIDDALQSNEIRYSSRQISHVGEPELDYAVDINSFIGKNKKPIFQDLLFKFTDQKGLSDVDVYKKAFIDKKLFSKIRSNRNYRPGKKTVIALCFSLQLSINETLDLLASAGYTLSDSDMYDLIIKFFLKKNIYSIHDVNIALEYFSLKPLIGVEE